MFVCVFVCLFVCFYLLCLFCFFVCLFVLFIILFFCVLRCPTFCPIMCLNVLWRLLRCLQIKDVRFVFTSSCWYDGACLICVVCFIAYSGALPGTFCFVPFLIIVIIIINPEFFRSFTRKLWESGQYTMAWWQIFYL